MLQLDLELLDEALRDVFFCCEQEGSDWRKRLGMGKSDVLRSNLRNRECLRAQCREARSAKAALDEAITKNAGWIGVGSRAHGALVELEKQGVQMRQRERGNRRTERVGWNQARKERW